ncbi:hypothetical protein BDV97DRAFT_136047 [Delphinella strobiligena]|nr:hypothetical protein BDV97DRAFT_136047 [Delphinella strobiligena]
MASILPTAATVAFSLSLFLQLPSTASAMSAMTYVGCFNSSKPMTDQGSYTYQTSGYCQQVCYNVSAPAMGLYSGSNCYCGDSLPAENDKVDDSSCDTPCQGYGQDDCGGASFWSVYKTGYDNSVSYYDGTSSSSSSSSSTSQSSSSSSGTSSSSSTASSTSDSPVLVTSAAPGRTVVITLAASATNTDSATQDKKSGGGSNTAGIAAGVVVGVVVAAALAGGAFFFFRNRKRKQIEEEYSKRSQAQDFGAAGAVHTRGMSVRSVSGGNDARLDPEAMMARRLSDGSIADEQDYSRRILKVTNPDDGR